MGPELEGNQPTAAERDTYMKSMLQYDTPYLGKGEGRDSKLGKVMEEFHMQEVRFRSNSER